MRAIGAVEYGGPEKLQVLEMPQPHAGAGEVRIRVHATPVVPVDISFRQGGFEGFVSLKSPYIPGTQAAGVISEVGAGASWQVGDKVMTLVRFTGPRGGSYADEIVVPANEIVLIPKDVDFVHASTLPMDGLTARAVLDQLALLPGQTLAVTGAAGIVGGYVIQLAKAQGLRVIADASAADEKLVRSLGADEVVRRGNDVADNIRKIVPAGVDGLADTAVLNELIAPAVRDGGKIAWLRPWNGIAGRGITAQFVVNSLEGMAAKIERLREQVESGVLTLRVQEVLRAARAGEAHRRLEAGGVRGRLVLDFS